MPIRIPDNLSTRAFLPGGADNTPNVTRAFGGTTERFAGAPSVPSGFGGVANPAAGQEFEVKARVGQQLASTVNDSIRYIEGLYVADEDTRMKTGLIENHARDREFSNQVTTEEAAERQAALDNNQPFTDWSPERREERYKEIRTAAYNEKEVQLNLRHPQVIAEYKLNRRRLEADLDGKFFAKVTLPATVANIGKGLDTDGDNLVKLAMTDPDPAAGAETAIASMTARLQDPKVAAFIPPEAREKYLQSFITRVTTGVVAAKVNELTSPGQFTGDGVADAAKMYDLKQNLQYLLNRLPMAEDQRLAVRMRFDDQIQKLFEATQVDAGQAVARVEREREKEVSITLLNVQNDLNTLFIDDKLSREELDGRTTKVANSVLFRDNPAAIARLEQTRVAFLGRIAAKEEEARKIYAATSAGIALTDQKSVDFHFTENTQKIPYLVMTPTQRAAANDLIVKNNYGELPTDVAQALKGSILSFNPAQQAQGIAAFIELKNKASHLIDKVDEDARDIAYRVYDLGQDPTSAREAVMNAKRLAPSERKQLEEGGQEYLKKLGADKDSSKHPLQIFYDKLDPLSKTFGGGKIEITPTARSSWNTTYRDVLLRGKPPGVAAEAANAAVGRIFGASRLLTYDNSRQVTVGSPEVVFNESTDNIREDVLAKIAAFQGIPYAEPTLIGKDTKWALQPIPDSRNPVTGKMEYFVKVPDPNNPGQDMYVENKDGVKMRYSYNASDNVVLNRQNAKLKYRDTEVVYEKLQREDAQKEQLKLPRNQRYSLPTKSAAARDPVRWARAVAIVEGKYEKTDPAKIPAMIEAERAAKKEANVPPPAFGGADVTMFYGP